MIVVADSSPLRYLIVIEEVHLLPLLYGRIIIPCAVVDELSQTDTPELVRHWIASPPRWVEIRHPGLPIGRFPSKLGLGEREAILLAEELGADALLVDDYAARLEAEARKISVLGTLGVLDQGAEQGFIDLPNAIEKLLKTNFRASQKLIQIFLDRDTSRKRIG